MVSDNNGLAVAKGRTNSEDNSRLDEELAASMELSILEEESEADNLVNVNFNNGKSDKKNITVDFTGLKENTTVKGTSAFDYQNLLHRIQKLEETSISQKSVTSLTHSIGRPNRITSVHRTSIWNKKRTSTVVRSPPLDPWASIGTDIAEEEEEEKEDFNATFPPDCYSMMALNGPKNGRWADKQRFIYFIFGFSVFVFQALLLGLAFYSGISWKRGTIPKNDNPGDSFFSYFIPPNANTVTRATQILSLMVFCIFPEASVQDVVTAIQIFPWKVSGEVRDRFWCLRFSCFLRWLQGVLAIMAVWLLVMSAETVIDIILNFTAINFISSLDDTAFSLAESGVFGPLMSKETIRISNTKLPSRVDRELKYVWYLRVMAGAFLGTLGLAIYVIFQQELSKYWVTDTLRVEFTDKEFKQYSGCFYLNKDAQRDFKRYIYTGHDKESNTTIGYCRSHRQWILFDDINGTYDPCYVRNNDYDLVRSEQTDSFDVSATFEESWKSSSGAPLDLFFFDSELDEADLYCNLAFGNGRCDGQFNSAGYSYDEGDCCAATCSLSNCGRESQATVFGDSVYPQVDFPSCKDPDMVPLTIQLNDIISSHLYLEQDDDNFAFREVTPEKPYFALECNDVPVLTTYIDQSMINNTHTVMVKDGSTCMLEVKNNTASKEPIPILDDPIWLVEYTIFHGGIETLNNDEAVEILTQQSVEREVVQFKRIPDCYLTKLPNIIEIEYIYPAAVGAPNEAIDWLVKNDTENLQCDDQQFIERYVAAKMMFSMEKTEFLSNKNQCTWSPIKCSNGNITAVKLEGDWGSNATVGLPSEIGLLTNLKRLELGRNLITSISSEIGLLAQLETLVLTENQITAIPTEIGLLTRLQYLNLGTNQIASMPSEIGLLTRLTSLKIFSNQLSFVPSEFFQLTRLTELWLFDNIFTSVPSEIGQLTNLRNLNLRTNDISTFPNGTLQLSNLEYLNLRGNSIAEIPTEIYSLQNLSELSISDYDAPDFSVICQNVPDASQYCDCSYDCTNKPHFCQCEEAQASTCCGTRTSAPTVTFSPTQSMSPTYSPTISFSPTISMPPTFAPTICEESYVLYFQEVYLNDVDADNSTHIDVDELQDYYSPYAPTELDAKEAAEDFFSFHDSDGNGFISAEEFANSVCNG